MSRARTLSRADIPSNFDSDATALVLDAAAAGWRGFVSGRRHVILYAPDGRGTISVSRDSLRGRSGRNARAAFERWEARQ